MQLSESYESFLRDHRFKLRDEGWSESWIEGWTQGWKEGWFEGVTFLIIHLGTKRFGPADLRVLTPFREIADVDRLERIVDRLFDATGWEELLGND